MLVIHAGNKNEPPCCLHQSSLLIIASAFMVFTALRYALLARYMLSSCVRPSVSHNSQGGTVPKQLNVWWRKKRPTVDQGL